MKIKKPATPSGLPALEVKVGLFVRIIRIKTTLILISSQRGFPHIRTVFSPVVNYWIYFFIEQ